MRQTLVCVAALGLAAGAAADCPDYDRSEWPHWDRVLGTCWDVRQQVLIDESLVPVEMRGCRVERGLWIDLYTGKLFTDPSRLDIDHVVPLGEVADSDGCEWDAARRRAYANDLSDPRTLLAVSASANRSKGARDPAQWLPEWQPFVCEYVALWQAVKERWGLAMDAAEREAVERVEARCAETGR